MTVHLLNGRDYVQGTQLLVLAARSVPRAGARLTAARFARTTMRDVACHMREPGPPDADALGTVSFMCDEGPLDIDFTELDAPAPPLQAPEPGYLTAFAHDGALGGGFEAGNLPNLQSLLEFMVQGLKRMHLELPAGAVDVWFTGLRGFNLPVAVGPMARCAAHVRPLRRLQGGGRVQTFSEVQLHSDAFHWHGQVSFAYRAPEVQHVD